MAPRRHAPWDLAFALYRWTGGPDDLGRAIQTPDIKIAHNDLTADGVHRVELTPWIATQNRKISGYVGKTSDGMLGGCKISFGDLMGWLTDVTRGILPTHLDSLSGKILDA